MFPSLRDAAKGSGVASAMASRAQALVASSRRARLRSDRRTSGAHVPPGAGDSAPGPHARSRAADPDDGRCFRRWEQARTVEAWFAISASRKLRNRGRGVWIPSHSSRAARRRGIAGSGLLGFGADGAVRRLRRCDRRRVRTMGPEDRDGCAPIAGWREWKCDAAQATTTGAGIPAAPPVAAAPNSSPIPVRRYADSCSIPVLANAAISAIPAPRVIPRSPMSCLIAFPPPQSRRSRAPGGMPLQLPQAASDPAQAQLARAATTAAIHSPAARKPHPTALSPGRDRGAIRAHSALNTNSRAASARLALASALRRAQAASVLPQLP